ncbi:GNAT family N-acetyltransferase [Enterovibrio sp. ZSDZ42]|uniref:GNAT family N-acetyltransferase n=1 Tax=Enterovibrio gelatinilyticus TaxID=2899819 RepID=A0ABT5R2P6_9GAMM|nr:GNAT family N-acetyltransferase [Enterovibrio sp. ZSDZ42]MDD1794541.1 GNAT family N-acetyltransferase [Enterovibrio sp. ZSDZ42]
MELIQLQTTDDLYQDALALRYDLFFREPKLPRSILFDSLEAQSFHLAMTNEEGLLAYGRLSEEQPHAFKISQMVVRPDMQGKGLGSAVLNELIQLAAKHNAKEISLNARLHAVPMYEKYGFETIGDTFIAASTGVPHTKMLKHC